MKIRSYLLAVSSIIGLIPSISSAEGFSYIISLSGVSVTQQNPRANGTVNSATSNSITLVGPNGSFYYPNLVSSFDVLAPLSASNEASAYLNNNPLAVSYLGVQSAQNLIHSYNSSPNIVSTTKLSQSDLSYLAGIGAPTNDFELVRNPQSDIAYAFSLQHYEVRYSYDYLFTSPDIAGFDYASGSGGLALSAPSSGHIDSLFSSTTNFNYSNLPIIPSQYSNTFYPPTSFNWLVGSVDNLGGAGNLTISNLTVSLIPVQDIFYVSSVPESETYAMLLAGLGVIGFMSRRKQA
jgi:hypothetical protein